MAKTKVKPVDVEVKQEQAVDVEVKQEQAVGVVYDHSSKQYKFVTVVYTQEDIVTEKLVAGKHNVVFEATKYFANKLNGLEKE